LVPIILGHPPEYFENDFVAVVGIISWFITQFAPNDIVGKFFAFAPCDYILSLMAFIFLGNVLCFTVEASNMYFSPSILYPTPMVAPIALGALSVTGNQFFPLDVGLEPISKGLPWNIQCGLFCAAFYHLAIFDDGPIGEAIDLYVAGPMLDQETTKWLTVAFFAVVGLYESRSGDSFTNPFAAVYKSYKTNTLREGAFALLRTLFVVLLFSTVSYHQLPHEELQDGQVMKAGDFLTTCSILPSLRPCTPHVVALNSTGYLNVFQASTPPKKDKGAKKAIWSSDKSASTASKAPGTGPYTVELSGPRLTVKDDGIVIWENIAQKMASQYHYENYTMIVGQGGIGVFGKRFSHEILLWAALAEK